MALLSKIRVLNEIRFAVFVSIRFDDEKTFSYRFPYHPIYLYIVWEHRGDYGRDIFGDVKIADN
jgi:hypothetical protein